LLAAVYFLLALQLVRRFGGSRVPAAGCRRPGAGGRVPAACGGLRRPAAACGGDRVPCTLGCKINRGNCLREDFPQRAACINPSYVKSRWRHPEFSTTRGAIPAGSHRFICSERFPARSSSHPTSHELLKQTAELFKILQPNNVFVGDYAFLFFLSLNRCAPSLEDSIANRS